MKIDADDLDERPPICFELLQITQADRAKFNLIGELVEWAF